MEYKGNLICPKCQTRMPVTLHKNVCMSFYACSKCKEMMKAKEGCCVFCDYGDRPCPVAPHE